MTARLAFSAFFGGLTFVLLPVLVLSEASGNHSAIDISHLPVNSTRDQIIFEVFDTNYKKNDRPTDDQTVVTVYMKILAITSVDVRNMQYTTDVYLRQVWRDPRLAWANISRFKNYTKNIVSPELKVKLWLPDLFFRNGKAGYLHDMTQPNYLMRISPTGEVLYSQKVTMEFSCQMDLHTFPMDKQECKMDIGSYGYTLDQLKFIWREIDPMVLPEKLFIPEFSAPDHVRTEDCTKGSSTSTGDYTCIKATFILQRQLGSYLASTYIPNILIIMVSWLNFWVSVDASPARVALGLLTLLGILTQASTAASSLPRVSYIKAIDIWTITCIMFVIGALIEFAVATTLSRRRVVSSWQQDVRVLVRQELAQWCTNYKEQQLRLFHPNSNSVARRQLDFCEELESLLTIQEAKDKKEKKIKATGTHVDVDKFSRILFPACFGLYNCFYWFYYLVLIPDHAKGKEES